MQIGDKVICVYAGQTDNLKTHGNYEVVAVTDYDYKGSHVTVFDLDNDTLVKGDYSHKRFMLESDIIKQVLENAKNG